MRPLYFCTVQYPNQLVQVLQKRGGCTLSQRFGWHRRCRALRIPTMRNSLTLASIEIPLSQQWLDSHPAQLTPTLSHPTQLLMDLFPGRDAFRMLVQLSST